MSTLLNILWQQHPIGEGWDLAPDPVVWVSVRALDEAWCTAKDYIGRGGAGSQHPGRYDRFGKFFVNARFVFMPTVALDDEGAVSFTDGRHRFSWLRDHGLHSLPIEVPEHQACVFETRFGTVERIGSVVCER